MEEKQTNPFYYSNPLEAEASGFDPSQQEKIRENNIFVFKVLTNIVKNNGKTDNLSFNYKKQICSGKLIHSDSSVDNGAGRKLKALYDALNKSTKARDIFNKSALSSIVDMLCFGKLFNDDKTSWGNYVPTENLEEKFKDKDALYVALYYCRLNKDMVGFNLDKLISTLVSRDKSGSFVIKEETEGEEFNQLYDGMTKFITSLKENPNFKNNFVVKDQGFYEERE